MEHIKAMADSLKIIIKRIEFLENKLNSLVDSSREAWAEHDQILVEIKHQQGTLRSKTDVELVQMIQTTYEKLNERIDNLEKVKL